MSRRRRRSNPAFPALPVLGGLVALGALGAGAVYLAGRQTEGVPGPTVSPETALRASRHLGVLGFDVQPSSVWTEAATRATARFQAQEGLTATGAPDPTTVQRLVTLSVSQAQARLKVLGLWQGPPSGLEDGAFQRALDAFCERQSIAPRQLDEALAAALTQEAALAGEGGEAGA